MDVPTLFLRTVLIYFAVFFMLRIMGKREIGKLSVFDLVISIMIAEIAVLVIEETDKPLAAGFIPMFTLVAIQLAIAYITLKSQTLRSWFDGKPSLIINKGKLNRKEMQKQRYSLDDLMLQLRENKVTQVADVEFAVLETSGKLTVIKKDDISEEEKQIDTDSIRYEGLPLPLIMDGRVQDENLKKINKTRFWLKNQIQMKGAKDFKEVFFCSIDYKGSVFVDKNN
ncbi:DUF421 domain-containing protein [Ferviditalea candida]|uniref:DUF421 domain-containing protein n=1 Tax=Ferviditalea candida TaxID=3108399 RepID=A0ABU5ZK38_9BACL|nr:DUF421 domain-containing protein [Paenibacillaceae bacterium T2]